MNSHLRTIGRVALIAGALASGGASDADAQDRQEIVGPTAKISRDSYKSWSLFLMCNPDWASADRSRDVEHVYGRFKAFGDAIGRENLAVWFWKERMGTSDPKLAENIDVAKSVEYCGVLGQKPSEGPYLVVTTAYPDLAAFPRDRAIFQLGAQEPAAVAKLLNALADQLLLEKKVVAARLAIGKGGKQRNWGCGCLFWRPVAGRSSGSDARSSCRLTPARSTPNCAAAHPERSRQWQSSSGIGARSPFSGRGAARWRRCS
jgi:hypothetical protein